MRGLQIVTCSAALGAWAAVGLVAAFGLHLNQWTIGWAVGVTLSAAASLVVGWLKHP